MPEGARGLFGSTLGGATGEAREEGSSEAPQLALLAPSPHCKEGALLKRAEGTWTQGLAWQQQV